MKKTLILVLLISTVFLGCATANVSEDSDAKKPGVYQSVEPSSEGSLGKAYLGREIALTMDFSSVLWLEREGREKTELPQLAIDSLQLKETDVVAEVGAGSGYMAIRMARKVPKGKVYAVDISEKMLKLFFGRAIKERLFNVEPVIGDIDDPKLPDGEVDVVVMIDAYHEFSHPKEMMEKIIKSLKPDGRVVLIEYREENPDSIIQPLHKMSEKQIIREMNAAGLKWVETKNMLPEQHFVVFVKENQNEGE